MVIQEKTISVALSQPPERKNPAENKISYPVIGKFRSQAQSSLIGR